MSKNKSRFTIIGRVNCDKCGDECDLKELIKPSPKQLKGAYYYKEWYHCNCGYWGRDEKDKVWTNTIESKHHKQVLEQIVTINGIKYKMLED